MFLKSSLKPKRDVLTLTLMKELSKEKKDSNEKGIEQEMESDEIAQIISERLLKNIQSKLTL